MNFTNLFRFGLAAVIVSGCQLKDPEQRTAALQTQRDCDSAALERFPVRNEAKNYSEPVYVNVPTGQIICDTKYVRQPNVVPGVGVLSHRPVTNCTQQTARQYSHTRTWQEIVDINKSSRDEYALTCKTDWCEANFDNRYWSTGYNDAELCVRTR